MKKVFNIKNVDVKVIEKFRRECRKIKINQPSFTQGEFLGELLKRYPQANTRQEV